MVPDIVDGEAGLATQLPLHLQVPLQKLRGQKLAPNIVEGGRAESSWHGELQICQGSPVGEPRLERRVGLHVERFEAARRVRCDRPTRRVEDNYVRRIRDKPVHDAGWVQV